MNTKNSPEEDWANLSRLAPRFWKRVDVREDSACWEFDGPTLESGHKRYDSPAGMVAHRYAWALTHGRLPTSDEVVRHRCDNPPCSNPSHLQIGAQVNNVADMIDRGRASFTRTHCRNGHERTPENTALRKNGERRCRICQLNMNNEKNATVGWFECPECANLLAKGNMKRHRKDHHGINDQEHASWLVSVQGQPGITREEATLRARAATIENEAPNV